MIINYLQKFNNELNIFIQNVLVLAITLYQSYGAHLFVDFNTLPPMTLLILW